MFELCLNTFVVNLLIFAPREWGELVQCLVLLLLSCISQLLGDTPTSVQMKGKMAL